MSEWKRETRRGKAAPGLAVLSAVLGAAMLTAAFPAGALAAEGGWQQDGTGWKYIQESGAPVAGGWSRIGENWYWFDGQGYMKTGWLTDEGRTYYMEENGAMAVGWREIGGNWYYFHEDGAMNTGDVTLGETECRFGVDGVFKSATRVENTGGGAFRVGCYDEMTQALFDQLNEEKTEEYFEEYSEREDEYDGDMKLSLIHIFLEGAELMHRAYLEHGVQPERILYNVYPGAVHSQTDWKMRFPDAIRWIFGDV